MSNVNSNLKLVSMNDADVSSKDKPIIGTLGLASCVGLLLYNKDKKLAIVAHLSSEWKETIEKVFRLISTYELDISPIKYKIISGYYDSHYHIKEDMEDIFSSIPSMFVPFEENELVAEIDEETTSKRFAFDSLSGMFVTKFVDFNKVVLDNKNKKL